MAQWEHGGVEVVGSLFDPRNWCQLKPQHHLGKRISVGGSRVPTLLMPSGTLALPYPPLGRKGLRGDTRVGGCLAMVEAMRKVDKDRRL